jgi:hypothetical protein
MPRVVVQDLGAIGVQAAARERARDRIILSLRATEIEGLRSLSA